MTQVATVKTAAAARILKLRLRLLREREQEIPQTAMKRAAKNGSIELRHYEDEYQMPIILVRTRAGKDNKEDSIFLWTNINAPIKETSESINVFCSSEVDEVNDKAFLSDVCTSFDYLWETYDTKEEKQA